MAFIKKGTRDSKALFIEQKTEWFDHPYSPDQETIFAGIYRCHCGVEIPYPAKKKLPPHDHHKCSLGEIEWKLLVSIDNVPKKIKLAPRN